MLFRSGNKSQGARTRALSGFKSGELRVLVATDIAARGLDIAQLPLVVNFDLPLVAADYVHRVGRTVRAGVPGRAVSLVTAEDRVLLRDIQKLLAAPLEQVLVDGFTPASGGVEPGDGPRPQRPGSNRRPGGNGPRRGFGRPGQPRGPRGSRAPRQSRSRA